MFRYILFDSSQHPRFHQKLEQWGVFYRSLFDGHAEDIFPELAPLLIDISIEREATQKVVDETRRIGKLNPCVSTLEATLPLVPLAGQFTPFHLVETPDGRSMLMRWYDTRILPVWLNILTAEQHMFFVRNITRWTSIDRFGVEQLHLHSEQGTETAAADPTPLRLDERQAGQLFAAAEPDALIFELRKTIRTELDRIPQHLLYPFVQSHWQMARQQGLHDQDDQIPILMLALYTSGAFIAHPGAAELFTPRSELGASFSKRIDALPESIWTTGKPLWEQ
jgi:hypothetical protein